jgi:hypothetical protein
MLKKVLFILIAFASPLFATYPYEFTLVDKSDIVTNDTYSQNLNSGKIIDYLSFQAVYSTPTYSVTVATLTAINSVTNVISSTQSYPSGFALLFTSSSYNYSSTTLTNNTTYYAFNTSATTLQISTGTTGSIAVILGTGTIGSFNLTPINIQASSPFNFKWQYSNDGSNWYDSTQSSVTVFATTTPTNYFWDFGFTVYKYIRIKLTSGNFGVIKLQIYGYGKRVAP